MINKRLILCFVVAILLVAFVVGCSKAGTDTNGQSSGIYTGHYSEFSSDDQGNDTPSGEKDTSTDGDSSVADSQSNGSSSADASSANQSSNDKPESKPSTAVSSDSLVVEENTDGGWGEIIG